MKRMKYSKPQLIASGERQEGESTFILDRKLFKKDVENKLLLLNVKIRNEDSALNTNCTCIINTYNLEEAAYHESTVCFDANIEDKFFIVEMTVLHEENNNQYIEFGIYFLSGEPSVDNTFIIEIYEI